MPKQSVLPISSEIEIDFIDVGCSGELPSRWRDITHSLNYVGFDPSPQICDRLSQQKTSYRTSRYLPYALGGRTEAATLHLTASPECASLLKPRLEWLSRFDCAGLFSIVGEMTVITVTLDELVSREELRADILKIDSQGLELPILQSAGSLVSQSFCIETETGLLENYYGESVLADIDTYMREQGFQLYDLILHRFGRSNKFAEVSEKQPLYCECLWLRDYITQGQIPSREKSVKALFICRALGLPDYGFELANYFHSKGLLSKSELEALGDAGSWLAPHQRLGKYAGHVWEASNAVLKRIGRRFLPRRT